MMGLQEYLAMLRYLCKLLWHEFMSQYMQQEYLTTELSQAFSLNSKWFPRRTERTEIIFSTLGKTVPQTFMHLLVSHLSFNMMITVIFSTSDLCSKGGHVRFHKTGFEQDSNLHHLDLRIAPVDMTITPCLQMFVYIPNEKWFQTNIFLEQDQGKVWLRREGRSWGSVGMEWLWACYSRVIWTTLSL